MTVGERIARLETSVNGLLEDIQRLPADVLYREPSPGEWPVMSTLAHLAELMPYWAHQAEQIVQSPGTPVGRLHDDPERLAAVQHHGRDTLEAMIPRLRVSLAEAVSTLRALPAEAWKCAAKHPRRGSMTVEQLVDAFLVSHAEDHAAQTRATLQTLNASPRR